MDKGESTRRMLDRISKQNREFDGRADYHKGLRTERERILNLIKELLPKYYEDGADEFAKQLKFVILGKNE